MRHMLLFPHSLRLPAGLPVRSLVGLSSRLLVALSLLVSLTPPLAVHAQNDCSDAVLLGKTGSWNKRPDANMLHDKHQVQIDHCLDSISVLFQATVPQPKGIEAGWYRTMDNPVLPGWPVAYCFNSLYFCWYCNRELHKPMLSGETGTWAYVYVNYWGWFFGDRPKESDLKIDGAFIYNLPDKVGVWKGHDIYQSAVLAPLNRCILLSRSGSLPWKPVTEEQYLRCVRAFLEDQKKPKGPSQEQQAQDDQKEIDRIQNNADLKPELKQAMLKGIRERQQMQAQSVGTAARMSQYLDQQTLVIDNYLANTPASRLQEPAILPRQGRSLFDGSFTTLQNGGQMKVTVNPAYLDRGLPDYRAQFMVLYWRWERNNAAALNFRQQFEADFPVDRLQAILDKP
jgi:hypothetical protein